MIEREIIFCILYFYLMYWLFGPKQMMKKLEATVERDSNILVFETLNILILKNITTL